GSVTKKFTRKGDTYVTATLEDLTGQVEAVFWPTIFRTAHEVLEEDAILVVRGRLEIRDGAVKLTADRVSAPALAEALGAAVVVELEAAQCSAESIARLREILRGHAGPSPVELRVRDHDGTTTYQLGDDLRVERRAGLFGELKAAFGPDVVEEVPTRTFVSERGAERFAARSAERAR
ncbi:MAG: hypothetical protein RLZZ272_631, partial [Actinomycetota bacterium]